MRKREDLVDELTPASVGYAHCSCHVRWPIKEDDQLIAAIVIKAGGHDVTRNKGGDVRRLVVSKRPEDRCRI